MYDRGVNWISRTIRKFAKTEWLRRTMRAFLTPLDNVLGKIGWAPTSRIMGAPLCYLTTTGRKSGRRHTVPLIYVTTPNGHPAVIGTNYGMERHPAWTLNLDADPRAELRVDDAVSSVFAKRLPKDEAAALWASFDAIWPGYERYREITDRTIKVYELQPAGES